VGSLSIPSDDEDDEYEEDEEEPVVQQEQRIGVAVPSAWAPSPGLSPCGSSGALSPGSTAATQGLASHLDSPSSGGEGTLCGGRKACLCERGWRKTPSLMSR
jgi:hypothetical protein